MDANTVTLDIRILAVAILLLLVVFAYVIKTIEIWLENIELRDKLGMDINKKPEGLMDALEHIIIKSKLLHTLLLIISVPLVAIVMWVKHPGECFAKVKQHFAKQLKAAKDNLFN